MIPPFMWNSRICKLMYSDIMNAIPLLPGSNVKEIQRNLRNLLGVMDILIMLNLVVVIWKYTYYKNFQMYPLRYAVYFYNL